MHASFSQFQPAVELLEVAPQVIIPPRAAPEVQRHLPGAFPVRQRAQHGEKRGNPRFPWPRTRFPASLRAAAALPSAA